ncbi:MAG TPA: DUF2905 domain-containing protein [Candidatus Margulisiibacteriota bacterium]|nr:DUF2905 domain-containing protein [Candidatus Margulisiibacteriota bacterium]
MQEIGKGLIILGIIIIGIGVFLAFFEKIPFVGKLPGDIYIHRCNFSFYFPLATSILVSIVLSLIMWVASRK